MRRDSIVAHLQPVYCLRGCIVYGFEALARASVDGIEFSGSDLLDAARAYRVLSEFDMAARKAAILQGGRQLRHTERLFINILPAMIENPAIDLAPTWIAAKEARIPSDRLVFEFVESESLPEAHVLRNLVDTIRREGSKVALDDFGAGHSSLAMIEAIRPDIVKFDGKLIPLTPTTEKRMLISGLVSYLHSMDIFAVAEGVETMEQLAFVQDCGFDLVQGWLLGRPGRQAVRKSVGAGFVLCD